MTSDRIFERSHIRLLDVDTPLVDPRVVKQACLLNSDAREKVLIHCRFFVRRVSDSDPRNPLGSEGAVTVESSRKIGTDHRIRQIRNASTRIEERSNERPTVDVHVVCGSLHLE